MPAAKKYINVFNQNHSFYLSEVALVLVQNLTKKAVCWGRRNPTHSDQYDTWPANIVLNSIMWWWRRSWCRPAHHENRKNYKHRFIGLWKLWLQFYRGLTVIDITKIFIDWIHLLKNKYVPTQGVTRYIVASSSILMPSILPHCCCCWIALISCCLLLFSYYCTVPQYWFNSFLFHGSVACCCNKTNKRRRSCEAKRKRRVVRLTL